jgi:AcrR family transcriptional regulator
VTRSDKPPTKDAIWNAAAELFGEQGYASTSVRDIAARAGIDASLVIRHFGSKENLFLDTMKLDLAVNALRDFPVDTLGERFIDLMLTTDDQVRGVYLALLRASGTDAMDTRLREAHEESFVAPLRSRLTGADAEIRARLAAALVGGLLYSLWAVGDETLLAADHDSVVRRYGALLQELITPRED